MPQTFVQRLIRKKFIDLRVVEETKLSRCLSTLDLTALGIGSTLGAGIYVVAGQVAKTVAGPSVVLSFVIAAIASIFAGLCYAEFGARVPKTGSAYVYSYYTVGELWAFIIGWNLILEYVIGTASVARAWSAYFDSLINKVIQHTFNDTMHMDIPGLSEYPDLFALGITLLLSVVLAIGVKESSMVNNLFTAVNLLVVLYVCITGAFKADSKNWTISEDQAHKENQAGDGGFFPFGVSGMLSGAATCFYAFVGFDAIATTGEEVKNPQKAIPISIVISLIAIAFAYCGISTVITLMIPYYTMDHDAPLPLAFEAVGWPVAKYVITVGALCGLSTSLLGAMFPMPRVIYAMASDGLIFRFLSRVNERTKTPFIATVVSGILSGVMAMMFDLKELVDMMSIGTLMAYTIVAACVLILRYQPDSPTVVEDMGMGALDTGPWQYDAPLSGSRLFFELFVPSCRYPTKLSGQIVSHCTLLIGFVITILSAVFVFEQDFITAGHWWAVIQVVIIGLVLVVPIIVIARQPQNKKTVTFLVPGVPYIPALSMIINIYLMMKLSYQTWIRFGVWMFIGFLIYFGYGIRHSSEEARSRNTSINAIILTDSETETERQPLSRQNEKSTLLKN